MNRLLPYTFLLAAVALMTGCKVLYPTPQVQAPLFTGAGEWQAGASIGSNGYGMQAAASPLPHIGLTLAGSSFSIYQDNTSKRIWRHRALESGLGFYTASAGGLRFETYAGYGLGSSGDRDEKVVFNRYFVQPAVGFGKRNLEAAGSLRVAFCDPSRSTGDSLRAPHVSATLLEPALTLRGGIDHFRFQVQMGYALPLQSLPAGYVRGPFVNAGINLVFGRDWSKFPASQRFQFD